MGIYVLGLLCEPEEGCVCEWGGGSESREGGREGLCQGQMGELEQEKMLARFGGSVNPGAHTA